MQEQEKPSSRKGYEMWLMGHTGLDIHMPTTMFITYPKEAKIAQSLQVIRYDMLQHKYCKHRARWNAVLVITITVVVTLGAVVLYTLAAHYDMFPRIPFLPFLIGMMGYRLYKLLQECWPTSTYDIRYRSSLAKRKTKS